MPFAEWYLSPWGNRPDSARVQIDPAEVWGCRGAFGPMLVLPYKLPKGEGSSASLELLALEGWIGLGNVTESDARLPIPSQIVCPAPQYRLHVPLTATHIDAIDPIPTLVP